MISSTIDQFDLFFHADDGCEPREENAAVLKYAPHLPDHYLPMIFVARKVKHRATQHHIKGLACKRHSFQRLGAKVIRRQLRSKSRSELANFEYRVFQLIDTKNLISIPEQINDIPTRSTTGIQHAHPGNEPALQELVKQIDINVS